MLIAINPYHLTSRELPAMAGLLLADHAVTLLPVPNSPAMTAGSESDHGPACSPQHGAGYSHTYSDEPYGKYGGEYRNEYVNGQGHGQGDVHAEGPREAFVSAVKSLAHYREFVESWDWSRPFWDEDLLAPTYRGTDALEDVRAACLAIDTDPGYALLRQLMRDDLFSDDARSLEIFARDVLRGGPDPAVCIPLSAGLDRFAIRHELVVARSAPSSLAQQNEARRATTAFRFSIPMLVQAPAELVLDVRDELAEPLADLREAVVKAFNASLNPAQEPGLGRERTPQGSNSIARVRAAAAAYADAFNQHRDSILGIDADELRPIVREVSVEAQFLGVDAVLESSTRAMATFARGGRGPTRRPAAPAPRRKTDQSNSPSDSATTHGSTAESASGVHDGSSTALLNAPTGRCRTLVFRVIG